MDEHKIQDLQKKVKAGLKRALQRLKNIRRKEESIGEVLRKNIIDEIEKHLRMN